MTWPTCDISYTWESVTIHPTEAVVHTHIVRCFIMLYNILLRKLIVSHKLSVKANWRNTTSFLMRKYITQERLHRKLLRRVMQYIKTVMILFVLFLFEGWWITWWQPSFSNKLCSILTNAWLKGIVHLNMTIYMIYLFSLVIPSLCDWLLNVKH